MYSASHVVHSSRSSVALDQESCEILSASAQNSRLVLPEKYFNYKNVGDEMTNEMSDKIFQFDSTMQILFSRIDFLNNRIEVLRCLEKILNYELYDSNRAIILN